jgi:hypothetical protein
MLVKSKSDIASEATPKHVLTYLQPFQFTERYEAEDLEGYLPLVVVTLASPSSKLPNTPSIRLAYAFVVQQSQANITHLPVS